MFDGKLTAVIPTLNEAARINEAVRWLHAIGVDSVVVVDGGSVDSTVNAAIHAGAEVLQSSPGRGHQLNCGAAAADSEVLWFVHADVRPPPDAVGAIKAALADPTVVGGAFRTRTVSDVRPTFLKPILPLADARSYYTRLPYGDQALFVRTTAFEQVGRYPTQPIFEDVELARKLWKVGRLVRLRQRVEVSARRFLARPLYYALIMNLYPVLYRAGVSPQGLALWYGQPR